MGLVAGVPVSCKPAGSHHHRNRRGRARVDWHVCLPFGTSTLRRSPPTHPPAPAPFPPPLGATLGRGSGAPSASVSVAWVSATNSMRSEPARPWSFFQAAITAPSLTQMMYTFSIPASSRRLRSVARAASHVSPGGVDGALQKAARARWRRGQDYLAHPSISAFLRPGTWHVDQVGVNAPGSVTNSFLPPASVPVLTGVQGVGPPAKPMCTTASAGNASPTPVGIASGLTYAGWALRWSLDPSNVPGRVTRCTFLALRVECQSTGEISGAYVLHCVHAGTPVCVCVCVCVRPPPAAYVPSMRITPCSLTRSRCVRRRRPEAERPLAALHRTHGSFRAFAHFTRASGWYTYNIYTARPLPHLYSRSHFPPLVLQLSGNYAGSAQYDTKRAHRAQRHAPRTRNSLYPTGTAATTRLIGARARCAPRRRSRGGRMADIRRRVGGRRRR